MARILQFKITLLEIQPPVWRRFEVTDDIMFYDLHLIIQQVMGWKNEHLYQFVFDKNNFIGDPDMLEEGGDEVADDTETEVAAIMDTVESSIIYEYDFGNGWRHDVVLEKISVKKSSHHLPYCLEGANNCPPEDCGGPPGFYNLMNKLNNEKHPEHQNIREWLGKPYDPAHFNPAVVNRKLKDMEDFE